MKRTSFLVAIFCTASLLSAQQTRSISLAEFRDKVRGAWAGKMIGVSYGAKSEFKSLGTLVPDELIPQWTPDLVREALRQDDLYVQMNYAEVIDAKGWSATTADFADMLKQSKFRLWHTSQAARRALKRGAPLEDMASPVTSSHGEDISFQIISDFLGLACPAMPKSAVEINDRVARVAAWGDGVCAGRFVAGMYTAAFFETDPRKIIEAGLASIPPERDYAKVIRDVLAWHQQYPDDWKKTWTLLNEKWDNQDRCPYGALAPLNIDAKLNGGYTAIGLLYGGNDFAKVLDISTRCGQDSDCNPCTAAGVWGAAYGFAKIPFQYTSGIDAMAKEKFEYTNSSFDSAVENTIKRAIAMAQANGGRVENDQLIIVPQTVKPTPVRDFPSLGKPVERIGCDDARWKWTGDWKRFESPRVGKERWSEIKGDEAAITFTGTGAIIVGPYVGRGGQADIYLDGKLDRTIDVYPDENRRVAMEDVWHKFNLSDGEHTIRVVVRGEPFADSKGTEIRIHDLVVFR